MKIFTLIALASLALTSCSKTSPLTPMSTDPDVATSARAASPASGRTAPGRPGYEPAFVNGREVTINAILVPPRASRQAQADFFLVVYPIGFETLGIGTPQCNPCDHFGDGIDFTDFHDHVLDSAPGVGGGQYSPLRHVFAVVPAYNGRTDHDALITTAYAAHIPAKSEAAVNELLDARLSDGSPVAVKVDKNFYLLAAVVSPNAAP